jgi:hypothetical protein
MSTLRFRSLPLRLLAVTLLCASVMWARASDDEAHHAAPERHTGSRLCIDASSVSLRLEGLSADRMAAQGRLAERLARLLERALKDAGIAYETPLTCAASPSFVALHVRVSALEPDVYRHYAPNSFGCALLLRVGAYADAAYLAEHPTLPEQTFEAFDEQVISEAGRSTRLEGQLPTRARPLLAALVEAWREDNP